MIWVRNTSLTLFPDTDNKMHEDYRELLGLFSEFKDHKLEFGDESLTLFTKPAFVEYDDGTVEEGLGYLLFGYQLGFAFVSEICFARAKTALEVFDMLIKARDCEAFYYVFTGRLFISEQPDRELEKISVKTHLGIKHCIYCEYEELVADDAVFFYGGDLLDGWSGFVDNGDGDEYIDWHVFRGSEWIISEAPDVTGVEREAYDAGAYDKTKSHYEIAIIEDYDDTNEIHRIAKALPFRRREYLDAYQYGERVHPQKVLLIANE